MEGNLQGVGNLLGNLKGMALDMGSELEAQNKTLERVNYKVTALVWSRLSHLRF